jgi:hypothetical protein
MDLRKRKIYGSKKEEIREGWKKLYNKKLHKILDILK